MKDVMGEACSTSGGKEREHTGVWWGNLKEKGHLVELGVGESFMFKWIVN